MNPVPDDPISPLAEGAAQLHELFLCYVKTGFTEAQALYLIGQIIAAGAKGGQP
jgi:hypothetical protein